jgi:hypothetical protein
MASRSKSTNSTENKTEDSRVSADGGSVGVSADGDVTIHQVADEAFELGEFAIETVGDVLGQGLRDTQDALARTQDAARTESAQLSEMIIKLGIPAAALVYIASKWK